MRRPPSLPRTASTRHMTASTSLARRRLDLVLSKATAILKGGLSCLRKGFHQCACALVKVVEPERLPRLSPEGCPTMAIEADFILCACLDTI